jgi:chaperonin GroES
MQTVKPSSNQLFCKPLEAETTTKSGFMLLEKSVEKPQLAEVVNVGDAVKVFKQHDTIIYKSYATTTVKLNKQEFFLINVDDALGTVVEVDE